MKNPKKFNIKLLHELLERLRELYKDPRSELNFASPYELVVSVILSAQCTDKKVNQITPELFNKFPDFYSLSKANRSQLEKIIRPINYYKTKAKNLIGMANEIIKNFNCNLPRSFDELITLPGVGRKTANVVLTELGAAATIPVDTHVFRVSKRLGLSDGKDVEEVESDLMRIFPIENWRNLHHWLIFHGRRVCKAQKPRCEECSLSKICSYVANNR